jgi:hypothetical protein
MTVIHKQGDLSVKKTRIWRVCKKSFRIKGLLIDTMDKIQLYSYTPASQIRRTLKRFFFSGNKYR